MPPMLEIVPLHFSRPQMLAALIEFLRAELGVEARCGEHTFLLFPAFDQQRGQYHATRIWEQLLHARAEARNKLLVLTEYDLFIPVLTFILGEAQLAGRAGIVSICRMNEAFYERPPNDELLFQRLCKETAHEVGHLFGLHHCYVPQCVMGPSTNIEGVDLKGWRYCFSCLKQFAEARTALYVELRQN